MDKVHDRNAILALVIGCLLAVGVLGGDRVLTKVSQQQIACKQVNDLRGAIVTVLQNGERALPHSIYFKDRPEMLRQAEATYQQDINQLKPIKC